MAQPKKHSERYLDKILNSEINKIDNILIYGGQIRHYGLYRELEGEKIRADSFEAHQEIEKELNEMAKVDGI